MIKLPSQQDLSAWQASFNVFGGLNEDAINRELQREHGQGQLQGRLIGLKANIAVEGFAWTAGLGHRAAHLAERDALVTRRLRDSGALILPGLNMDAAALGGTADNPYFGGTSNPHAPEFSAGGSSGGSAAAVAAGIVECALGTDTLGSIRIPASYCGVFGLKPTHGLVGRSGVVPLAPSLDTVGPLVADAADLWPLMTTIAGLDPDDPASRTAPESWHIPPAERTVAGLRIGVPHQIASVDCAPDVLSTLTRVKEALFGIGATVLDVDMPGWQPARLRHMAFLLTEAEGAVAFAAELENGGILPASVEKLLKFGRSMPAAKLVSAVHEINTAQAQLERAFAAVDVLLMPTTPQRAFLAEGPAPVNQADFTALANAGGVPALAAPVWAPGSRRPNSVQLVGPKWSESTLIGLVSQLHAAL